MSWLADAAAAASHWRQDFIATFLQRNLPALGLRVPAEAVRRFWTMLAPLQGQLFNAPTLGAVSHWAVRRTTRPPATWTPWSTR